MLASHSSGRLCHRLPLPRGAAPTEGLSFLFSPQPLSEPPLSNPPSPKPPSLIAVPESRKNVIDVASVFLEDCEAALKSVLCGRLGGWDLSCSLIIGRKS